MLVTLMGSIAGNEIPPMRNTNKKRLCRASTKADAKFKNITLNNITKHIYLLWWKYNLRVIRCEK